MVFHNMADRRAPVGIGCEPLLMFVDRVDRRLRYLSAPIV
jgi:hypothetical protein